jgi:hypothetical protein
MGLSFDSVMVSKNQWSHQLNMCNLRANIVCHNVRSSLQQHYEISFSYILHTHSFDGHLSVECQTAGAASIEVDLLASSRSRSEGRNVCCFDIVRHVHLTSGITFLPAGKGPLSLFLRSDEVQ